MDPDGAGPWGSLTTKYVPDGTGAWYLTDGQGTVGDLADLAGVVQDHLLYTAFGQVTSESQPAFGDRWRYTGREFEAETGLQYNRARYYDPAIGRWISEDPIGLQAGDPNLYRYVCNAPTLATDPSGELHPLLLLAAAAFALLAGNEAVQAPTHDDVAAERYFGSSDPGFAQSIKGVGVVYAGTTRAGAKLFVLGLGVSAARQQAEIHDGDRDRLSLGDSVNTAVQTPIFGPLFGSNSLTTMGLSAWLLGGATEQARRGKQHQATFDLGMALLPMLGMAEQMPSRVPSVVRSGPRIPRGVSGQVSQYGTSLEQIDWRVPPEVLSALNSKGQASLSFQAEVSSQGVRIPPVAEPIPSGSPRLVILVVPQGTSNPGQVILAPATTTPANSPLLRRYLSESGGRWGGTATRQLNHRLATDLETRGFRVTGGAGRAAEEWIPGPGGGARGGTWVDITATNGTQTTRIQTVATLADGVTPTASEAAAAARIRAAFPNDTLILVSKQTGLVIP